MKLFSYESLDSTNLQAKRLLNGGSPVPFAVCAKTQSAGRGRRGRSFSSPEGGLYLSIVLPFDGNLSLTAKCACTVCRTVEKTFGLNLSIKWLNDLLFNGRKVCGILTEGAGDYAIVGIGINVCGVPSGFEQTAASLFDGASAPQNALQSLTDALCAAFSAPLPSDCIAYYRSRLDTLGKDVNVYAIAGGPVTFTGKATDITDDFHLVVETADGDKHILSTGEVTIRTC